MQKLSSIIASSMPWLIIGGLLYAALFIELEPVVEVLPVNAIERRDDFYGVAHPTEETIWLAGTWGKVIRSDDNGKSWIIQQTGTREHLQDIYAWDDQNAVLVGNNAIVLRTEDGGKTWQEVEVRKAKERNKLIRIRGISGGKGWAIGMQNGVFYTEDYGKTWEPLLPLEDRTWYDLAVAGDALVLVGEYGAVMRSEDNGKTWQEVDAPTDEASLNAVTFRDANHGAAVGVSGHIILTDDGGKSWRAVPPATKLHLFDVTWDDDKWFVIGEKGVWLAGLESKAPWKGGRLSYQDLSWHTEVLKDGDRLILAGASVGYWQDGTWVRWSSQPGA